MKTRIILTDTEWKEIQDELKALREFKESIYYDVNPKLVQKENGTYYVSAMHCKLHNIEMTQISSVLWECKGCSAKSVLTEKKPFVPPTVFELPDDEIPLMNGESDDILLPEICPQHGTVQSGVLRKGQFMYLCLDCEAEERLREI